MSETLDIKLNILLVSRRKDALDSLESALRPHASLRLQRKLVVNGHTDPLHDVATLPDVLILHLGETWRAELESLAARPADRRPGVIVVGSASDTQVMRLAMQAGARDLLPLPLVPADLVAALARVGRDRHAVTSGSAASLSVFMNAKGGCGATLLACSVAHILSAASERRVMLVDLDLQFGAIPLYFDLFPKRGVLQALENLEGLDEVALDGYVVKHANGLKVLGQAAEDALPIQPVSARAVEQLLSVSMRGHHHVIVDLPRRIDVTTTAAIERAQNIVLVVQQSVATLRDATRLMRCLRHDLGVGKDRIVVVVNRYDKNGAITAEDIQNSLSCADPVLVPNDFATVSRCIDAGTPLFQEARNAAITRAVMTLETRLGGTAAIQRQGLLARTFSSFTKSRST